MKSWWNIPLVTGSAAKKVFRYWKKNSESALRAVLRPTQQEAIIDLCLDQRKLEATPVNEFVDMFVI